MRFDRSTINYSLNRGASALSAVAHHPRTAVWTLTTTTALCCIVAFYVTVVIVAYPFGWTWLGLKQLYSTWKGDHHP